MAYQVLARKYRPETFQEVIGQNHITETLTNAFSRGRIAHAYLFAGPRGVGKTTTARILAKAINCLNSSDGTPCNRCQNCTEIAASRSMDVVEIDGASNRGIDEIRNLREMVKYTPMNASAKIFIIDEVHMLTPAAFNALLKTLEEPPEHVKFVFATTEPGKVLPTILSRCQRHDFHRLSLTDIFEGIDRVVEREGITIDGATRQLCAEMADGSMRDALSLLDQLMAYCGNDITHEKAVSLLGIIPNSLFFDVTDAVRKKDRKRLLGYLHDIHSHGYALGDFVVGLSKHLLNLLVGTAEPGEGVLDLAADLKERYLEESKSWDPRDLLRYADLVNEMQANLKRVQQPRIYLETMMLKLLELDSSVSIRDVLERLGEGSGGSSRALEPEEPQEALFDNSPEPVEEEGKSGRKESGNSEESPTRESDRLETIKRQWDEVISKVSKNGTSLGTFLSHGIPTQVKGKRLIVSFPREYRFQIDVLKKNLSRIETSLEEAVGQFFRVEFVVSKEVSESKKPSRDETDPVTQRMLDLFGGEIVE
ncbi:MAG: DNA polymerase III subunit gamma/tau [Fidelibacterota bacterium]